VPSIRSTASAGGWQDATTIAIPAGTQPGDLMLTWLSGNAAGEITTPAAGWTLVESDFGGDVGEGTGVHLYARTATSELSPYTWGWSGEHWHYGLCITVQDTGGIRDSGLAADEGDGSGVLEVLLPSVGAVDGDMLLAFGFHWGTAPGSDPTFDDLDQVAAADVLLVAALEEISSTGPTEEYPLTASVIGRMAACAVALRPPSAALDAVADPLALEVDFGSPAVAVQRTATAAPFAATVGFGAPSATAATSVSAHPLSLQVGFGAPALDTLPPERAWEPIPARQPLPPRPLWRYYALRWTGTWVHRELPLRDVSITHTLSGPGDLSASIEPTYADLVAEDGHLVLREWDTIILAEAAGQLRGAGILVSTEITGDVLSLDCVGFSGYAAGMPLTASLTWGGSSAGATGQGVDPAAVIRALWAHLQGQPDGNLGVVVDNLATPYRLGVWHNARKLPTEDEPNPPAAEVEEPPIPIDRVWTQQDSRPAAATGKSVYWEYRLDWFEDVEVGSKQDEICQQAKIEYREHVSWGPDRESVNLRLQLGYPRLGRRAADLRFVEGENISELVTLSRSGDAYANVVAAYGSGEGSKQKRQTVSQRDGRLRRVSIVDAEDVATDAALKAIASDALARARQLTDITAFTVRDHPNAELGSFDAGDDVLVETVIGWQPTRMWVRILSYTYSPDGDTVSVTCTRSDSFDYSGR